MVHRVRQCKIILSNAGVVIGKTPPLEKTLPFTGAQNVCLQISNSEGGAQKNGYFHSLPYGKMYVPDLKPMCDLDLKTVLFEIKNPYRSTKNPYRRSARL